MLLVYNELLNCSFFHFVLDKFLLLITTEPEHTKINERIKSTFVNDMYVMSLTLHLTINVYLLL